MSDPFGLRSGSSLSLVFPDWVGAVLNGTGAINWWINEFVLWSKQVAVSHHSTGCSLVFKLYKSDFGGCPLLAKL